MITTLQRRCKFIPLPPQRNMEVNTSPTNCWFKNKCKTHCILRSLSPKWSNDDYIDCYMGKIDNNTRIGK